MGKQFERLQSGWIRNSLLGLGAVLALMALTVVAGAFWLGSASGLAFLLEQAEQTVASQGGRFQATGAHGGLYRGVTFDRLEWSDGKTSVQAVDISARWSLRSILRREVVVPELSIGRVTVRLPEPDKQSAQRTDAIKMPQTIGLPVSFELSRFRLAHLLIYQHGDQPTGPASEKADGPIEVKEIRFGLNYQNGAYGLSNLDATLPWGTLRDTRLSLNDTAPHALVLRSAFRGSIQAHQISVKAAALGNLNGFNASVKGAFDQSPVSVDIRMRPLEPNPVVSVTGWIRKLDLGRLEPPFPKTAIDVDFDLLNPRALPHIEKASLSNRSRVDTARSDGPAVSQGEAAWRGRLALRNTESGSFAKKRLPLRTLSANLQLDATADSRPTRLTFSSLKLGMPGANKQATVRGTVQIALNEQHRLAGSTLPVIVAALQFRDIDAAQFIDGASPTAMDGSFDLTRNLFRLDLSQSQGPLPQAVSLLGGGRAAIQTSGRLSDNAIHLDTAVIQLNASRLSASGRATLKQPIELAMGGSVENLDLNAWLPRKLSADMRLREGLINADWSINGKLSPVFDAQLSLNLARSTLMGQPLTGRAIGRLKLADDQSPMRIHDADLKLRFGSSVVSAQGNLGAESDQLNISGLLTNPGLIEPRLAGSVRFEGRLLGALERMQAQIRLSGQALQWQASKQQRYRVDGLEIEADLPVATQINANTAANLSLRTTKIVLPGRQFERVAIDIKGRASQHNVTVRGATAGQRFNLAAAGGVNLSAPLFWEGRVTGLNSTGTVRARLNAAAQVKVGMGRARIEGFDFRVLDGRALIRDLDVHYGGSGDHSDTRFMLTGELDKLPVAEMVMLTGANSMPAELKGLRLSGQFSLSGSGTEDLTGAIRLGLTESNGPTGKKTTPAFGLSGSNGADIRFNRGKIAGNIDISLPSLAFSRQFTGTDWVVDGRIRLAGQIAGSLQEPVWDARLTGDRLSLFQPALGWRFSDGKLDANFAHDKIDLRTLSLKSGDGTLNLSGSARLVKPSSGRVEGVIPLDGRFTLTTDRTVIPLGPGQRLVLSGESAISSTRAGLNWSGTLLADEGLIEIAGSGASALPDDVVVTNGDTSTPIGIEKKSADADVVATPDQSGSPKIRANLAIDLGNKLRITGGGVNATLTGKLLLHGDLPDSPKVTGDVNIKNGSYLAYNQKLTIERGAVRFAGALDNPLLDIVALRPELPVKVGVALGGTALSPRVQLTSTPRLSDAETLSWLVLGAPLTNAQAGAQTLALKQAAAAFLGSDDGSLSSGGLSEKIGVNFGIGYASDTNQAQAVTDAGSPTGLPGSATGGSVQANQQVFTLGKKLSKRLSVSYEKGLEGVWNLLRIQYEISNRLSLRAQTGSESALDLMYFFSFD